MTRAETLLTAHDAQVRGTIAERLPGSWTAHPDGGVLRVRTPHRGFAFSQGLHGLSDKDVAGYVARTRDFLAEYAEPVEWKTYAHDHPSLTSLLRDAGFEPQKAETVLVAGASDLAAAAMTPPGVTIRSVTSRQDLERVAEMETDVWGEDWSWLSDDLTDRLDSSPNDITIYVAEADGEVIVSAAWLVVLPGTSFAGLWGGSTLSAWRRRGIYRSLVALRAREALTRGLIYLWVDASDDSRPILERLGMTAVATTTPWVWQPST